MLCITAHLQFAQCLPKQKKVIQLIPIEYRPAIEEEEGTPEFDYMYERFLKITDYVSGMTDGYAISLYRRIKGISI